MSIRRLAIVALLASAGAAHADTITTPVSSPSNYVSGWTTGNGTDVLASGVLHGNLNLVGGVAYSSGSSANASLTDVLYGKIAGTIGQVDGQTKLFFQRGIEAQYLLASGHGILAATLGPGKSVVGSADGAVISDAGTLAPVMTGGGSLSSGGNGGGASNSGTPAPGGSPSTPPVETKTGATTPGTTNGNGNGADNGNKPETVFIPGNGGGLTNAPGIGNDNGIVKAVLPAAVEAVNGTVPEPSSIMLMLAGLMGAGALGRRRAR